jgi:hypothetical protein
VVPVATIGTPSRKPQPGSIARTRGDTIRYGQVDNKHSYLLAFGNNMVLSGNLSIPREQIIGFG